MSEFIAKEESQQRYKARQGILHLILPSRQSLQFLKEGCTLAAWFESYECCLWK